MNTRTFFAVACAAFFHSRRTLVAGRLDPFEDIPPPQVVLTADCAADEFDRFDSLFLVRLSQPTFDTSIIVDNFAEAYGRVAGTVCDSCFRRVVTAFSQAPKQVTRRQLNDGGLRRSLQTLDFQADTPIDFVLVRALFDQSGVSLCQTAFDTDEEKVTLEQTSAYADTCGTFGENDTCCCVISGDPLVGSISKEDFRKELDDLTGEIDVVEVIELAASESSDGCTFGAQEYQATFLQTLCLDWTLDSADYTTFFENYIATYNLMTLNNCVPTKLTGISNAGIFDLPNCPNPTTCYEIEVEYIFRDILPQASCTGFCPEFNDLCDRYGLCRRRIQRQTSEESNIWTKSRPQEGQSRHRNIAVLPVEGGTGVIDSSFNYIFFTEFCYCPVGDYVESASGSLPTRTEFESVLNINLVKAGLQLESQSTNILPAPTQIWDIPCLSLAPSLSPSPSAGPSAAPSRHPGGSSKSKKGSRGKGMSKSKSSGKASKSSSSGKASKSKSDSPNSGEH